MNDAGSSVKDNVASYESLSWIIDHSDDGLFLVTASARMQREVARHYSDSPVAIFDYSREERPFQVGSFSRLLEREPGKRAYFFLNFQLAIPEAEDVERFNFCRDILSREKKNLVFFVNQEAHDRLNRGALDLYSYIRLFMPFADELPEAVQLEPLALPVDRSTGERPTEPDFTQPRSKLLTQAIALRNRGKELQREGRYEDAASFFRTAAEIRKRVLGENHPDTSEALHLLGGVFYDLGLFSEAKEALTQALKIRMDTLGESSPFTAESCNSLGLVYQAMGDFSQALEFHDKALKITEAVLGPEHPDTAATYNNLGGVYQAIGDYDKALEYYDKARTIREAVLGPAHPNTALTWQNMAMLYYKIHDLEQALRYSDKALAVFERVLGPEHPNTITVREDNEFLKQLSDLHEMLGDELWKLLEQPGPPSPP